MSDSLHLRWVVQLSHHFPFTTEKGKKQVERDLQKKLHPFHNIKSVPQMSTDHKKAWAEPLSFRRSHLRI